MLIQGLFNNAHFVGELFLREYAFSLSWLDKKEIRVAHSKGTWFVMKIDSDKQKSFFKINDMWEFNGLGHAMVRAFIDMYQKELKPDMTNKLDRRSSLAFVLAELTHSWVSPLEGIQTINCFQPGRNARLDEETGDFISESVGHYHQFQISK